MSDWGSGLAVRPAVLVTGMGHRWSGGLGPGGGLGVWAYSSSVWLTSTFPEGPTDPCAERALHNRSLKEEIMEAVAWVGGQRWAVFPERACSLILSQPFGRGRVCVRWNVLLWSRRQDAGPGCGAVGLEGVLGLSGPPCVLPSGVEGT